MNASSFLSAKEWATWKASTTLNETGARIWELLDGKAMVIEIRDKITEEFDVTPEEAEKDLVHHLQELASIKAILETELGSTSA